MSRLAEVSGAVRGRMRGWLAALAAARPAWSRWTPARDARLEATGLPDRIRTWGSRIRAAYRRRAG